MDSFFQKLVYSASNEDPSSELKALSLNKQDEVLCLTGSGARPLDLLTASPKKVVSIDFNPRQNWLLELKVAAIKHLSYTELIAFLGVIPDRDRWNCYRSLRSEISPEARKFWDKQAAKIKRGVLYSGVWESYQRWMKVPLWPRRQLIEKLFNTQTLAEQWELWQHSWDTTLWKWSLRFISQPFIWKYILKEPGFVHISPQTNIAEILHARFNHTARTIRFCENPFVELLLRSRYSQNNLPLHLQPKSHEQLKNSVSNLSIVTERLDLHMEKNPNCYSAFSLSDFSSYCDQQSYREVWKRVLIAAKQNAKVCERFFLVPYDPESMFPGQIKRSTTLENDLAQEDHSFIYTFGCSTITKTNDGAELL